MSPRLSWLPARRQIGLVADRVRQLPLVERQPVRFISSAVHSRQHRDELRQIERFVVFVGHPRSGHSMVGSLLDAHPDAVVAHELDVLRYVAAGYRRAQLLTLVLERSAENAAGGRRSWEYTYAVPGQWQGRFRRLSVVGDKRGAGTTRRLAADPGLLDRLGERLGVPVCVVQIVRDPFDNIATMWRRGSVSLEAQIDEYFALAATVDDVAASVEPARFHRVRLEDVIADPPARLGELAGFVGLDVTTQYLDACASIVYPAPKRTRDDAPWTPELRRLVERRAAAHHWLTAYDNDVP